MPRKRKIELREWQKQVSKIKRESETLVKQDTFMQQWKDKVGENTNVTLYRLKDQRKKKQSAKRARKRKLGGYFL